MFPSKSFCCRYLYKSLRIKSISKFENKKIFHKSFPYGHLISCHVCGTQNRDEYLIYRLLVSLASGKLFKISGILHDRAGIRILSSSAAASFPADNLNTRVAWKFSWKQTEFDATGLTHAS